MELVSAGLGNQLGRIPIGFLPSRLPGLKLWCRFNSGIIETGLGVSQWTDVSGNGNHLLQGTDLDRPQKQADGSILFDGVRQFLKASGFIFTQPEMIYILGKQITSTSGDRIFDGNTQNSGGMFQQTPSPTVSIFAGATVAANDNWVLDTYEPVAVSFNGASSSTKIGSTAETTGNAGANDMSGFVIGADGNNGNFGHIQVKEIILFSAVHDAATRAQNMNYLAGVGGLSI